MFHLLPEKEKEILKKEYYYRLIVMVLLFFIMSAVVASVFLFPSYILSEKKLEDIKNQNTLVSQEIAKTNDPATANFLSSLNTKLSALNNLSQSASSTDYIKEVTDRKIDGISLNDFSFNNGQQKILLVGGNADTRDHLTDFYTALQGVSDFQNVDLPISDFAKESDIDFNVTITIK